LAVEIFTRDTDLTRFAISEPCPIMACAWTLG